MKRFAVAFATGLLCGGVLFALLWPGGDPADSAKPLQRASGAEGSEQDAAAAPPQEVEDFAQSLAEMLREEAGGFDSEGLGGLAARWAAQDPEQAFQHFADLLVNKGRERAKILVQIIGIWAKTDPEAALAAAEGFPETLIHKDLIHAALTSFAEMDPARAIDLLESQTKHRWPGYYGETFRIWAERDAPAAIRRLASLERSSARLEASKAIVGTLAKSDMEAAVRFAETLEAGYHRNEVLGQMFYETRVFDPAAGAKAIGLMSAGGAKFWGIENFILGWAQCDAEAAADWTLENLRGADRDYAIMNLMEFAESRPDLGMRLLDELPDGPYRVRAFEIVSTVWARADPAAASEWIGALPQGPDRDAAVGSLIREVSGSDVEAAAAWAGTISNEELRSEVLGSLPR